MDDSGVMAVDNGSRVVQSGKSVEDVIFGQDSIALSGVAMIKERAGQVWLAGICFSLEH